MERRSIRLSLVGHSGSGKSTCAELLGRALEKRGLSVEVLKVAAPLYRVQSLVYDLCGIPMTDGSQDQVLLECVAGHMRRISPTSLADDFERRLGAISADAVLNDDVRDREIDYPRLRNLGFRFIKVWCDGEVRLERLRRRGDITSVSHSKTTANHEEMKFHHIIDNSEEGIPALETLIDSIVLQEVG